MGFLLIEALVAILILSIALVASIGGIAQALHLAKRSEDLTKTILHQEKRLFEWEIKEYVEEIDPNALNEEFGVSPG